MNSIDQKFPSIVTTNTFGNCLSAKHKLPTGTRVQKFITVPTEKKFRGALSAPVDERHLVIIGNSESGEYLYGRVISDARYVNHSCNPNCQVTMDKEIVTLRPVEAAEELTIGYDIGNGKWEESWNFKCFCMAEQCRKVIDSYKNDPCTQDKGQI